VIARIALGVVVFVIAGALDFADTRHKIAVEQRDGHRSGLWSVAMYVLGLVGLVSVLDVSKWYVLPEAVGLYVGSRVALRQARPARAVKVHPTDML
jgi:hypothetical protein